MSFIVSARKYRPQKFSEVIGQDHIVTTIKNSILNNKIAHAYLFSGPRGVGKTTTARLIAKSINCLSREDFEPCGKCSACQAFDNSQSYDIIELDAASNRRIEDIRVLIDSVKYPPTVSKYKIYIIDEVHMLTTESFNALLKTLEEPPEYVVFIFATTDLHKVPATIKSRCQRFDFKRMDVGDIVKQLKIICENENITYDDKSLYLIAQKADGAMRDAESIFDQVATYCQSNITFEQIKEYFALIDEEIIFQLIDDILNKNVADAFIITHKIYDNGWNYNEFINETIRYFKYLLELKLTKNITNISETNKDRLITLVDKFTVSDIIRMINFLNQANYELKSAQNQRIFFEITLCNLILIEKSATITELINVIKNNEVSLKETQNEYSTVKTENINTKVDGNNPIKEEIRSNTSAEIKKDFNGFLNYLSTQQKLLYTTIQQCSTEFNENSLKVIVKNPDIKFSETQQTSLKDVLSQYFGKSIELKIEYQIIQQKFEDDDMVKAIKQRMGGSEIFK